MIVEANIHLGQPGSSQPTGLYQAMLEAGLRLPADCGGGGRCGRCLVQLVKGHLQPPKAHEQQVLDKIGAQAGMRLACQAQGLGPVTIKYHPAQTSAVKKTAAEISLTLKPAVKPTAFKSLSLRKLGSTNWGDGLAQTIKEVMTSESYVCQLGPDAPTSPQIALEVLSAFSLRKKGFGGGEFVAAVDNKGQVRSIYSPEEPSLGLAIDVGTTTVALILADLKTGLTLARRNLPNPQSSFGSDVISRMEAVQAAPHHLALMRQLLITELNQAAGDALGKIGGQPQHILDAVIVANPTMQHIIMGLNPTPLGRFPYLPIHPGPISIPAQALGLAMAPGGRVETMPMVSGYIGADAVAALLALGPQFLQGTNLLMDVGTNGELILCHNGHLLATSCATGPVFEGAHIKSGTRAVPGAVDYFKAEPPDTLSWTTIDGHPPVGLCGTGVISALCALIKTGKVDRYGLIIQPDGEDEWGEHLILIKGKHTAQGHDLRLYQGDIRQVQTGKSALRAGLEVLMHHAGVSGFDQIYMAGAFGGCLPQEVIFDLGILPPGQVGKVTPVGNAAGEGARQLLLNTDYRAHAVELAARIEVIELMLDPSFENYFIKHTYLGEPPD